MQLHDDIIAGHLADILSAFEKLHAPHRHSFYHIALITRGSGTKTIDFEQFDIHPGMIYFMVPGQVHAWDIIKKTYGYVINFSEKVFRSLISNHYYLDKFPFLRGIPRNSVIGLKKDALKEVICLMNQICNEVKRKDGFSLDLICFHLLSLFICITRHNAVPLKKHIPEKRQNALFNFRMLVNQHYKEKRLPKEYAALLYITPNHLNSLCKDLLDKSAGQIIRDRILLEAKRLLVNLDISIAEIAYQLNFTDNSYFSKFFKKYTGSTPEEFRKHAIENGGE